MPDATYFYSEIACALAHFVDVLAKNHGNMIPRMTAADLSPNYSIIPRVTFSAVPPDSLSQFLCDLLRLDQVQTDMLEIQMADMDWVAFSQLAASHLLAGVAYKRLRQLAKKCPVPPIALDILRPIYLSYASQSLPRSYWLGQILKEFHARGIPVIVLKGAYLAEVIYADNAARPMGDIDLLVNQDHLNIGVNTLVDLGYAASEAFWLDVMLQTSHHLPIFSKQGAPPVEVHWRLFAPDSAFDINIEDLWRRAHPTKISDQPALCLSPEDLLLHLCLHNVVQHRFESGLRGIYDVAVVTKFFSDGLNWDLLVQRAIDFKTDRAFFLSFWLAVELFGMPIPLRVLKSLQPSDFTPEIASLSSQLIFTSHTVRSDIPLHLIMFSRVSKVRERLSLVWQTLFLSPALMSSIYPVRPDSWKVILYYPVRWWSLFIRFIHPVWSILRNDSQTRRSFDHQRHADQIIDWITHQ